VVVRSGRTPPRTVADDLLNDVELDRRTLSGETVYRAVYRYVDQRGMPPVLAWMSSRLPGKQLE